MRNIQNVSNNNNNSDSTNNQESSIEREQGSGYVASENDQGISAASNDGHSNMENNHSPSGSPTSSSGTTTAISDLDLEILLKNILCFAMMKEPNFIGDLSNLFKWRNNILPPNDNKKYKDIAIALGKIMRPITPENKKPAFRNSSDEIARDGMEVLLSFFQEQNALSANDILEKIFDILGNTFSFSSKRNKSLMEKLGNLGTSNRLMRR